MFEYHVTYGVFKKIVKSESNIAKDILDPIRKAFSLNINASLLLQYWNQKHKDWVDCGDADEVNEETKLHVLVLQEALDFQQLESLPLSKLELQYGTPSTSNSPAPCVFEELSLVEENPSEKNNSLNESEQKNLGEFPYIYKLPQFPQWLQALLDSRSHLCKEAQCSRAIIDTLFKDLLRYGYYPTPHMFHETSRALVEAYPILKDKQFSNCRPYDSWVIRLRDKFKKFRCRNADLCNVEELKRMKSKFGSKRIRCTSSRSLDESLTLVKRVKVPQLSEYTEDEFSINNDIKVLQEEYQKLKPNEEIIQDKMYRTFQYRAKYVTTHSVAETLTCFPPLRKTDELLLEAERLEISEHDLKVFLILKKNSLSALTQKRKQKNYRLSKLLSDQTECASTADNELAFTLLSLPCIMNENFPILYVEEQVEITVLQPIIIHRNTNIFDNSFYELHLDKQLITKTDNLITAITLWFLLFWLFDVGYSKSHFKFLSFLDVFVFKKCSLTSVARSVTSLYNVI